MADLAELEQLARQLGARASGSTPVSEVSLRYRAATTAASTRLRRRPSWWTAACAQLPRARRPISPAAASSCWPEARLLLVRLDYSVDRQNARFITLVGAAPVTGKKGDGRCGGTGNS